MRLALVNLGETLRPEDVRVYPADTLPTFTDALMRFEREKGIDLRTCDAALAVAGPVVSGPIRITRTRWTISRESLASSFGREPLIINEVAARAWAVNTIASRAEPLRGGRQPDFSLTGRTILLLVEEGVGSATIDIAQGGSARIVEGEGGLIDFAAADTDELAMAAALNLLRPPTWEDMLTLPPTSPAWSASRMLSEGEKKRLTGTWLGRFTANMILGSAAWNGVLLVGKGAAQLQQPETRAAFDATFAAQRTHRRPIQEAPCWYVQQTEPVLAGTFALLGQRARSRISGTAH